MKKEPVDLKEKLRKISLTDRERKIMEYRYGLTETSAPKAHTLEETGKVFRLTRQRVEQITKRILTAVSKIK